MKVRNLALYARGYVRYHRFTVPPIVVGGCERSGTTLLQSILSAHPRIHSIADELWAFCHGPRAGFRGHRPIRMSRLYKNLGGSPISSRAHRWAEKSPANVFYFQEIIDHFKGRVRLIQLVRDGRDVCCSKHPSDPSGYWVPIQRWVDALEAGLPYRHDPRTITIRYEDLVLRYEETIQRLVSFLDEPLGAEIRDWHQHATNRESDNLFADSIRTLHRESVRKFEQPGFRHSARIEAFMEHPRTLPLLQAYCYDL